MTCPCGTPFDGVALLKAGLATILTVAIVLWLSFWMKRCLAEMYAVPKTKR